MTNDFSKLSAESAEDRAGQININELIFLVPIEQVDEFLALEIF